MMSVLYVLATPISGDYSHIPSYQVDILKEVELFIGEERRPSFRLLASIDKRNAPLIFLNEHSTQDDYDFIIDEIKKYKKSVFFSDCGTPAVADPGYKLIDMAYSSKINIISLPGPSSITTALSISGFYSERFYFAGFPPKGVTERKRFLKKISQRKDTVVLMERPYVLNNFLSELTIFERRISISFNLGMPNEKTVRGYPDEVINKLKNYNEKNPFILVIEGKNEKSNFRKDKRHNKFRKAR